MRWACLFSLLPFLAVLCAGCATTRTFTLSATPPDAAIKVDGVPKGRGHYETPLQFSRATPTHTLSAARVGYKEQSVTVGADTDLTDYSFDLKPLTRRVNITVTPVPGFLKVDGNPVASDMVAQANPELEFMLDAHNNWTTHVITAERPGFVTATAQVTYDPDHDYTLTLTPVRHDVTVTTTPPGASVYLDDPAHPLGVSPAQASIAFDYDDVGGKWLPHTLLALKPGWQPTTQPITSDNAQTEYHLDLAPKSKVVRVTTDPPGGTVTIGPKELPRDGGGISYGKLLFPPTDEKGTLPTYTAVAVKKTQQSEWEPREIPIGWEDGRPDYVVKLKEVTTRPVETTSVGLERNSDGGWDVTPRDFTTVAKKSVTEGSGQQPVQLYKAPHGVTIDTLTVSPDGSQVLFTLLFGKDKSDFRSLILAKRTDGSGDVVQINDGNSLDVMPSYTPDGDQIVFASNRSGRTLSVWERSVAGVGGVVALSSNRDEQDLWPGIDADPRPRTHLFYEALFDGQPNGHLYMATLNTTVRSELTGTGVSEPRVSPKADSVAFVSLNEKTGKRRSPHADHRRRDRAAGGSPDSDSYDPAWSRDGGKLAFASDRGVDEDRRHNADIWILDLSRQAEPIQVTTNGSTDDCPAWDPSGNAVYFRSNRGGEWGIWRMGVR